METIRLRYAGQCACGAPVAKGERAGYVREERRVVCLACVAREDDDGASARPEPAVEEPADVVVAEGVETEETYDAGAAGAAAQREFERRAAKRAAALAERNAIARFFGRLEGEPQSTRAWAQGAEGERRVAEILAGASGVLALHDRRIPGKRANIDHIAVGPAGVFVIDAKKYKGATIRVQRVGGLFSPRRDELLVRGRVRNALVEGVQGQVEVVRAALAGGDFEEVAVTGVLCFLDADFPLRSRGMSANGVRLVGPRRLVEVTTAEGPLDADTRTAIAAHLARKLPSM